MAALRGDVDTLNYLVDAGNELAADRLAQVAASNRDVATLQRLVDEGNEVAATHLRRVISEIE